MDETAGHILKSDEVELEGRVQLDVLQSQLNKGGPKGTKEVSAIKQVRILENHPEFAVIEITCCCGERTYLRCEYDGETPPGGNPAESIEGTAHIEQTKKQKNG